MRKHRRFVLGATTLSLAIVLAACGSGGGENNTGGTSAPPAQSKGTITVGTSDAFAENQIVAEMYAQVLEAAGYTVKRQMDLASREISDKALASGDIDIKPEYLGSELVFLDPNAKTSGDPQQEASTLAPLLKAKDHAVLLDYSAANDTNSFVVTAETAQTYGLHTVSDLAKPAP